jgi:hypothetical protein
MAVVTITLRDTEDGQVHINAESDPPFKFKDQADNTDAQLEALAWLGYSVFEAEAVHDITLGD